MYGNSIKSVAFNYSQPQVPICDFKQLKFHYINIKKLNIHAGKTSLYHIVRFNLQHHPLISF